MLIQPLLLVVRELIAKLRAFSRASAGRDSLAKAEPPGSSSDVITLDACKAELNKFTRLQFVPPGHFYSPIVAPDSQSRYSRLSIDQVAEAGIDFQLEKQKELLLSPEFKEIYDQLPFPEEKTDRYRFFYHNPAFSYSDAISLFFMLRHFKPSSVIEVGSGYSSALMLDTFDHFFPHPPAVTFIEPFPQLLRSLFVQRDKDSCRVIATDLQKVPLETFKTLDRNDILFIDSTHVAKSGSDVNYVISQVLPCLRPGTLIHFHDIFSDFEYPDSWIEEGRNWNEVHMLRSFLQFNTTFEILFFDELLVTAFPETIAEKYPLMCRNKGGSLWLRKTK